MNENDLLISIGADLSSFDAALKRANTSFTTFQKAIRAKSATKLSMDISPLIAKLKKAEDAVSKYRNTLINKTRLSLNIDVNDKEAMAQISRLIDGVIAEQAKAITDYEQAWTQAYAEDKARRIASVKQAKGVIDSLYMQERLEYSKMWKEAHTKNNALKLAYAKKAKNVISGLYMQEKLEYSKMWKEAHAENAALKKKEVAQAKAQAKRIADIAIKSKKATYDRILKIKHLTDRKEIAAEYKKLRKLSHAQLREYEATEKKKTAIYQRIAAKRNADAAVGRGFLDSVQVVAKYGAISQALYGIQQVIGNTIMAVSDFDKMLYENIGVLNLQDDAFSTAKEKAAELVHEVERLGIKYGIAFSEIHEATLSLGRAGIGSNEIKTYTEQVVALATITGDSLQDSADAIVSYKEVYKTYLEELVTGTDGVAGSITNSAQAVEQFAGRMAFLVNETILGMADMKVIGNYALSAATSINLTYDSLIGLAGAFSKLGKQPSTIGTSIRRLGDITLSTTDKMTTAWRKLGVDQGKLQDAMAKDGKTGEKAIRGLIQQLGALKVKDAKRFQDALKGLNVRSKELLATLAQTGELGKEDLYGRFSDSTEGVVDAIAQAEKVSLSFSRNLIGLKGEFSRIASVVGIDVINELNKFITGFDKDGPHAVKSFTQAFEDFGRIALKVLTIVMTGLASLIAMIDLGFSGFSKLAGKIDKEAGSLLGGVTTAQYDEAKKMLVLAEKQYALDVKSGKINQYNIESRKEILDDIKKTIITYEGDSAVQKFTKQGEEAEGEGDKRVEQSKELVASVVKLGDAMWKAADGTDELGKNLKKATEETNKAKLNTDDTVVGVIAAVNSEKDRLRIKKDQLLLDVQSNKITSKQATTARLQLEKDYYKDVAEAAKIKWEGDKSNSALLTEYNNAQSRAAKANYTAWMDAQRAKEKASKGDKEDERRRRDAMQMAQELAKQESLMYQISLEKADEITILRDKALLVAIKEVKAAKQLVKDNASLVKGTKTALQLEKDKTDALKKEHKMLVLMTKEMKKWENVFDDLFSGDLLGAFEGLFGDMVGDLQKTISTLDLFGGEDEEGGAGILGSVMGGLTGSLISFGLDQFMSSLSTSVTEAQIDAARGLSASEYTDDSIANMTEAFEDAQYPMLEVTNKIHKHIRNMDDNFYSIARAITGATATSGIDITGGSVIEGIYDANLYSSKTTELLGAGLVFTEQTLEAMADATSLYIQGYESIKTTKDYWWKTSVTLSTTLFDLPPEVVENFANAFASGYESIMTAGVLLGLNQVDLEEALRIATITLGDEEGKIDLSGLDAEGVADALNNIFSTAFSQVIDQIEDFDRLVDRYATGAEQSLETLLRIALEYEQAAHMFDLIGKDFFDSILTAQEQVLDIVASVGGLTEFNDAMNAFMTNFYTDTEQLGFLTESMATAFDTLNLAMPQTNDEFRTLLETMDTSTEEGAYLYGQVLLLAEGFAAMSSAAEDLGGSVQTIIDAWMSDLSYLTIAQKDLLASSYLDIAKEDDTISTVDAARSAAEAAMAASSTKEEYIPAFERYIAALEDEIPEATNDDIVFRLDELIIAVRELEDTTIKLQPEDITEVRIVT